MSRTEEETQLDDHLPNLLILGGEQEVLANFSCYDPRRHEYVEVKSASKVFVPDIKSQERRDENQVIIA